jgi:hypothetical protein
MWRRMEKISWTDCVNNEAVLNKVKEERNIFHTVRRRKANWIGHILRRNCLLTHIIEGKIRGTRRWGRRRKHLLDDLKEARRYWKLKEEAQDRILWRTQCARGYGPVANQTTTWTVVSWRSLRPFRKICLRNAGITYKIVGHMWKVLWKSGRQRRIKGDHYFVLPSRDSHLRLRGKTRCLCWRNVCPKRRVQALNRGREKKRSI